MQLSFSIKVALQYFVAKKRERLVSFISGFSMLGVMIGVASLIIVMAVMNGFHVELTKNILGLNSDITIMPYGSAFSLEQEQEIIDRVNKFPFIKTVDSVVNGQALVVGPRTSIGAVIHGITSKHLAEKKQIISNIIAGNILNFSSSNRLILGLELAKTLGVKVGDQIKMISPNTLSTAFGSVPRVKMFIVDAVFRSGLYDYDSAIVIMEKSNASKFLSLEGKTNLLEVYSVDPDLSEEFVGKLRSQLTQDIIINSWQSTHIQFLNALQVERGVMFMILSLIVIVACFNIVSSLFMLVKDKTYDIAILRTIGASRRNIMMIFVLNGLMIGCIGTILGLILGVSFTLNINTIREYLEGMTGVKFFEAAVYLLYNLPAKILWIDVAKICLLSLITSLLSTLYPAYRAASLNPIETLRNA